MKKVLYLFTFIACVCLSACGGDGDEPDTRYQDVSLNCEQIYTIEHGEGVEWTSSNKYVASVAGNIVKAERVGVATISSSKGSFKVTVNGTLTAYKIPCIEWGASKSTVKNFMKGSALDEETPTGLTYTGTGAQMLTMYKFENNGLVSSSIGLNGDYIDSETLIDFMMENYVPVSADKEDYSFYFITPDNKTALGLTLRVSGRTILYIIVYIPRSDTKGTRGEDQIEWRKYDLPGVHNSPIVADKFNEIISKF